MPRARYRKRSPFTFFYRTLLVAGVGVFLFLALGFSIHVPFTDPPLVLAFGGTQVHAGAPVEEVDDGRIRVPVTARRVPAYSKLSRDDVWNPNTAAVATVPLDPEQVERDGIITDLRSIFGRVLKRNKEAGYVFTEADFMPKGTRPGIAGGIPPGKRALRVEIDRIEGLVGLSVGDAFDVVSALPVQAGADDAGSVFDGLYGPQFSLQAQMSNAFKQATVRVLVQGGEVISGLETRVIPTTVNTLTQGAVTRMRTVQEIWIAVAPGEVAPLMEAMAIKETQIHCAPRSGHPDDPGVDHVTPELDRPSGMLSFGDLASGSDGSFSLVETIDGDERTIRPVRRKD